MLHQMKEVKTEIIINSNPEKVWKVLTDFENHSTWNPFIINISGDKKVGAMLSTTVQVPDSKKMSFTPKVLNFEENKELRWLGKLFFKGVFDGEHYFTLKEEGNGKTRFIHGEKFSGALIFLSGLMLDKTKRGFDLMNKSLKNVCESE